MRNYATEQKRIGWQDLRGREIVLARSGAVARAKSFEEGHFPEFDVHGHLWHMYPLSILSILCMSLSFRFTLLKEK